MVQVASRNRRDHNRLQIARSLGLLLGVVFVAIVWFVLLTIQLNTVKSPFITDEDQDNHKDIDFWKHYNVETERRKFLAPRKMSSTSNPIYFLHIGKAGGTSIDKLIPRLLKERDRGRKYVGFAHYDWSFIQMKEGKKDISAHADVITFLRHPVKRAVSQFHFSKRLRWAKKRKAKFINQTFDEYIKNPGNFRQPIADGESGVRFLAGLFQSGESAGWVATDGVETELKTYLRQNKTATCLLAAERLDQTPWFGILEDVERSMKLLQLTMDLNEMPTMPKSNQARSNIAKKVENPQPSEETVAIVKQYVPQDLWLYEYAQRLFEARWDYFTNANGDGKYIHPQLPPLPNFEDEV